MYDTTVSICTPTYNRQKFINCLIENVMNQDYPCLLYTSPSPRDRTRSRMPSSA